MEDRAEDVDCTNGDGIQLEVRQVRLPPQPKPKQRIQPSAVASSPSPRVRSRSEGTRSSSPVADASDEAVVKKPTIPKILHSSSVPERSDNDIETETSNVKPSSILKKRKEVYGATGPSVSFELDESMTRTTSTDSNLSCESETGYFSSGSGNVGLLNENRPILRGGRRSSLGNTESDSQPNELQSILKRKYSLDSSALLRDTSSSPSSLSIHSLSSPEPKPILKNASSSEELVDDFQSPPRPILKKRTTDGANATQTKTDEFVRPILKRPTSRGSKSEEDDDDLSDLPYANPSGTKGILKRTPPPEKEIIGISVAERMSMLMQADKYNIKQESESINASRPDSQQPDYRKLIDDEYLMLHLTSSPSVKSRRLQLLNSMFGHTDYDREPQLTETTPQIPALFPSDAGLKTLANSNLEVKPCDRDGGEGEAPSEFHTDTNAAQVPGSTFLNHEKPDNSCQSDPNSLNTDETDATASKVSAGRTSESQVFVSSTSEEARDDDDSIKSRAKPIRDRIAALKADADASWLKRVPEKEDPKLEMLPSITDDHTDSDNDDVEAEKRKEAKSKLIANRLTLLEKSKEGWKERVSKADAANFTVQGRLEMAGKIVKPNDEVQRIDNKPTARSRRNLQTIQPNQDCQGSNLSINKNGHSQTSSSGGRHDDDNGGAENDDSVTNLENDNDNHQLQLQEKDFDGFFGSANTLQCEIHEIEDSSFSSIVGNREQMLGFLQRVRVNRRNLSKNPVKALATRLLPDADDSKNAQIPENAENNNGQDSSFKSHLSPEALAGLASKEDFSAIKLKRAVISTKGYPHPMLIQIKGKRFVQTKLVSPTVNSLNNGDCFILVTGTDQVFQYAGEYSNRMERSKSAEVLAAIKRKRDLGCGPNAEFHTIEQPCTNEPFYDQFILALGGGVPDLKEDTLGDKYDEEYESEAIAANRVFKVDFSKKRLIPLTAQPGWSTQPKYSLFTDDRAVLVFDFGSEMYAWSGSRAEPEFKKLGTQLAREMFESTGLGSEGKRPSWCWFKKIVQFMEPVLFREKFFDWPDDGEGRLKYNHESRRETDETGSDYSYNFEPCDPKQMLEAWSNLEEAGLELECFNVGRGREVRDEVERRTYIITTLDVVFCHISDVSTEKPPLICHFYSTETYVIRWSYYVTHTSRDLKGGVSRHAGTRVGRDRIAYFFWHGAHSKITEKGMSALMTVELDEEKGPQIRVDQGSEPPAFLALFSGFMFIHSGSPEECRKRGKRLYVTMGGVEDEGHFVEVMPEPSSFRSRSSFLHLVESFIFVWHGCASSSASRKVALKAAEQLITHQNEFTLHGDKRTKLVELEEGTESEEFLKCCRITDIDIWRKYYGSSMSSTSQPTDSATQFFRFTSINGIFEAIPVTSARRSASIYDPFPILQEELLSAQQPALYLISSNEKTWLWQSSIQEAEDENLTTGSQRFRWAAERKAALESAISFAQHRRQEGFLVHAGHEPPEFRALFPYWRAQAQELATDADDQDKACITITLQEAIQPYRKQSYSLEELQSKPDGVDILKLETYLTDSAFMTLLKMSREDFAKLQPWKRVEMKKRVGLF